MKKQVIIMASIAVLLAVVALIVINFRPGRGSSEDNESILGNVKINDIKKMEIKNRLVFIKNGSTWSYVTKDKDGNYIPKPTRQDYIKEMLDALDSFNRGRLVDSSPQDLSEYHLDDNSGARLLVLKDAEDNELLRLKIGVKVGALSANYAQINNNIEVYEVDESLPHYLNQGEQYWLNLRAFPDGIQTNKVKTIKIEKQDRDDIVLNKNRQAWKLENSDAKINTEAVENYLNDVNNINAYNFSDPLLKDEYKNGVLELTLSNNDVIRMDLYFFANKYFATTVGGQENEILFFQEFSINKLFPELSNFIDSSSSDESEEAEVEEVIEETSEEIDSTETEDESN